MAVDNPSTATEFVRYLLEPRTIAVIGASRDPRKWGHRVIVNTVARGYAGKLFAVNPAANGPIAGAPAYPRIDDVPEPIDCAFLAVPAGQVLASIEACAAKGVRVAVVSAAGFGESGPEGLAMQQHLAAVSKASGLRIVGPNCFGVFRDPAHLALLPYVNIPVGPLALVSQSGNVSIGLFQLAHRRRTGFSTVVGLGNQMDISFADILRYLAHDPSTLGIALYMEGLPGGYGPAFLSALEACVRRNKPVAVVKVGRSTRSSALAGTHSGALASNDRVWTAMLEEAGAVRVTGTEELLDVLRVAIRVPRSGRRVMVVTDGGGDSLLAADAVETSSGLSLATLTKETRDSLTPLLPPLAPRTPELNPVTLDTPGGLEDDPRLLGRVVDIVQRDPNVDVVVVAGVFGAYREWAEEQQQTANALAGFAQSGTRLLMHSGSLGLDDTLWDPLVRAGVPLFESINELVNSLARWVGGTRPTKPQPVLAEIAEDVHVWSPEAAADLLSRYGISLPPFQVVPGPVEAATLADRLGYPICVKVIVPEVVHKAAVGGVRLGLLSSTMVQDAVVDLRGRFPAAHFLVMPSYPAGPELFLGSIRDPIFGPVLLVGRGGVWTEIEDDMRLLPAPTTAARVRGAIGQLRVAGMLERADAPTRAAVDGVAELGARLSHLVAAHPHLSVDLNPVLLVGGHPVVVDWRIMGPRE